MKRLFVLNANSHGRGAVLFAWHPTGNFLATCGQNRIVNIVNRQGEPHAEIPLDGTGKCAQLEWSADGELLAVLQAGSPNITLWDANHSSVSSLDTGTKDISYICWSRAGPRSRQSRPRLCGRQRRRQVSETFLRTGCRSF